MNILFLTADSLRADRTSLFDHHRNTTPFLEEFATEAHVFERAYANGYNTATSFPAIHCSTYGSVFEGMGLPAVDHTTLAEALQQGRYSTFGTNTNELLSREYNYDRGFDVYEDSRSDSTSTSSFRSMARRIIDDGPLFELAKRLHFFSTETFGIKLFDTADSVSGFADRVVEYTTNTDGDWFVWAHYMNPHHPYEPPSDLQRELGLDPVSRRVATKVSRKMRRSPDEISDAERNLLRGLYDAEVLAFDREVADLTQRLQQVDEFEDTLVLLTADHGELLGEDGLYGHPPVLRQPLLRVPLLVRGPVPAGVTADPVPLLDVPATILALAGRDPPATFEGQARFDVDGTPRQVPNRPIIAEAKGAGMRKTCCIRGDEKVVYSHETDEWECRKIDDNGFTETPVDDPYPELRDVITTHYEWSQQHRTGGAGVNENKLQEDLSALGYLEE